MGKLWPPGKAVNCTLRYNKSKGKHGSKQRKWKLMFSDIKERQAENGSQRKL